MAKIPKPPKVAAKGEQIVTFDALVWRGKGNAFLNPATGKTEICPGGEWHEDREGKWYDHGTIAKRVDKFKPWSWLWLTLRMELQEIKKFVLIIFRRKLQ